VPVAKVHTIADIFADPHFAARGMLARVPHPALGSVTLAGIVPRLSDSPGAIAGPGHELGADTDAVLRDWLGHDDAAIAALRAQGALRGAPGGAARPRPLRSRSPSSGNPTGRST
jgi:crotonobetainyl-CoA:carnitine CoA-transferase CaiB-like acyl-CoA transferase